MNRVSTLGLIVTSGLGLAVLAPAQPQAPAGPNVAAIEKVRDNLYMITGGGGNTAAYVTGRGVVLVDTKDPGWGQAILDKLKSVTDKPVTHIVNTHTHGDHVGSNEFFAGSVEIVTQENTDLNMKKQPAFADPAKKHALADKTFKDRMTLLDGADAIDLLYFGPGHTDGDAVVIFRTPRVAHVGDLFPRKSTPLLDMNNGGSGVRIGETLARAALALKDVDVVITGHSPLMRAADVSEYADFNQAFLASVRASIAAGKTPEQAFTALQLPARFNAYAMSGAKDNVSKIYAELGR